MKRAVAVVEQAPKFREIFAPRRPEVFLLSVSVQHIHGISQTDIKQVYLRYFCHISEWLSHFTEQIMM